MDKVFFKGFSHQSFILKKWMKTKSKIKRLKPNIFLILKFDILKGKYQIISSLDSLLVKTSF